MSEHTPTPWRIDGEHLRALVRGADGTIVALRHRLPAKTHVANAEFIVRACNSHDELVAALRFIEEREKLADGCVGLVDYPHTKALRAACKRAREALAKVESVP